MTTPKYILIKSTDTNGLKFFNTDEELLNYMESWGRDIIDPVIYQLSGKVSLQNKLTIQVK